MAGERHVACESAFRRILKEMEMDGVDLIHLPKDKDKWWGNDSGLPGRYVVQRVI